MRQRVVPVTAHHQATTLSNGQLVFKSGMRRFAGFDAGLRAYLTVPQKFELLERCPAFHVERIDLTEDQVGERLPKCRRAYQAQRIGPYDEALLAMALPAPIAQRPFRVVRVGYIERVNNPVTMKQTQASHVQMAIVSINCHPTRFASTRKGLAAERADFLNGSRPFAVAPPFLDSHQCRSNVGKSAKRRSLINC